MKLILRLLIGIVFLLSGIFKLSGIDGFELFAFKTFSFNWDITTILVRLLISLELLIGLFYLLGIFIKLTSEAAFILVSSFSVWLIIQWINGNTENCHCFGEIFQMNPAQSLLKNAILIVLILFLFLLKTKNQQFIPPRFIKIAAPVLVIISLVIPIIISPPDFLVGNRYNLNGVAKTINFDKLDSAQWKGTDKPIDLTQGKAIVLFMSMKCPVCVKAAKKISIINARYNNKLPVSYIFFGDSTNMDPFWKKSESTKFPYKIIPSKVFYSITKQMPTIMFLNNGEIDKALSYHNLNDAEVKSFLKSN